MADKQSDNMFAGIASPLWRQALQERVEPEKAASIARSVRQARLGGEPVYPPEAQQFAALDFTSPSDISVVILGQDPYHGAGQANGLAFSVQSGVRIPPSLRNILKEVNEDVGATQTVDGDLTPWAKQGVLLLNTVLTVEAGKARSHQGLGWQAVTHETIQIASDMAPSAVFLLWGKDAHAFEKLVDTDRHLVLKTVHPSPLSAYRGFSGCGHFSKANRFLERNARAPIVW